MTFRPNILARLTLTVLSSMLLAPAAGLASPVEPREGVMEPLPTQFKDVGVDEHMGRKLPMDTVLLNEKGDAVTLGSLFTSGKPVILQLGYFKCAKLCDVVSHATVESL